jgi:hypothetical protein
VDVAFIDVGDVEGLAGGDEPEALQMLGRVGRHLHLPHRLAFAQGGHRLLVRLGAGDRFLVAAARRAPRLVECAGDTFKVRQHQLGLDGVDVAHRVNRAFDVGDVRVFETTDHVKNCVHLAQVGQELVAEPLAGAGAAHQARHVHHLELGGLDLLSLDELVDDLQPVVRYGRDADVGLARRPRETGSRGAQGGQRVEHRALADLRQTDDSDF